MGPIRRIGRICWVLALICRVDAYAGQSAHFSERPRVAYTAAELQAWTNNPARAGDMRAVLADADNRLSAPVEVPHEEGQWYFFYLCPHDGTRLTVISKNAPDRHRCPTCGAEFDDERTVAAYRGIQWGEVDQAIDRLALAYALSRENKYALEAKRLFLAVADVYPKLVRHDRWGCWGAAAPAGGRRYAQRLDEATSGILLAKAYDLIADAPCMSDADRAKIETDFFRVLAHDLCVDRSRAMLDVEYPKEQRPFSMKDRLTAEPVTGDPSLQAFAPDVSPHRSNHQAWQNACLTVMGLALGDETMMRDAVYGDVGLQWQIEHSVTREGLWYELCMNYHFYALSAWMETLQAADRVGWSFRDNARLRSMWEGPVRFAYPDGTFPTLNDADADRIQAHDGAYQWAHTYFGDAISEKPGTNVSTNMTEAGLVLLRNGDATNPVCVVLDYGPHGGQHGHPDKLNIAVFACGREVVANTGRIGYSYREYQAWVRTTAANNTIVIGEKNQQPAEGRVVEFAATLSGGSVTAECATAYPGWVLRRTLTLEGSRLTDVVTVQGNKPATLDLFLHVRGVMEMGMTAETNEFHFAEGDGYGELKQARRLADCATNRFAMRLADERTYHVECDGGNATFFAGKAVGTTLQDEVPFVLRRVEGTQAVYNTTFDFSSGR